MKIKIRNKTKLLGFVVSVVEQMMELIKPTKIQLKHSSHKLGSLLVNLVRKMTYMHL